MATPDRFVTDSTIEGLKEKRRIAAARVRHRLQQLEEAEREFADVTQKLADATQEVREPRRMSR